MNKNVSINNIKLITDAKKKTKKKIQYVLEKYMGYIR